jgi:hypothetical protein
MTATMNASMLETQRALESLINTVPAGSQNTRAAIELQLEMLNQKLENMNASVTSTLVSTSEKPILNYLHLPVSR